jgi:hypothetical protein
MQGNTTFLTATNDWDQTKWFTQNGYMIGSGKDHSWSDGLIKTKPGEAIRLVIHNDERNAEDFYFKFMAIELPWVE